MPQLQELHLDANAFTRLRNLHLSPSLETLSLRGAKLYRVSERDFLPDHAVSRRFHAPTTVTRSKSVRTKFGFTFTTKMTFGSSDEHFISNMVFTNEIDS